MCRGLTYRVSGPSAEQLKEEWFAKRDEALRQLGVAQTCGSIGFISSKYESYLEAHFRKNGRAWA